MNRDEAVTQGKALMDASKASPVRQYRDELASRAREFSRAIKAFDGYTKRRAADAEPSPVDGGDAVDPDSGEVNPEFCTIELLGVVCPGMFVITNVARQWEAVEVSRIMPSGDLHAVMDPSDPYDKGAYLNFHSRTSPVAVRA